MACRRRLLLDASALAKAEKHPRSDVTAVARRAVWMGTPVLLPALVYAKVWRNDGQYGLRNLRRWCEPVPLTVETAQCVGALLNASGTANAVNASVIVAAIETNAAVMTRNPGELGALAEAVGVNVPLIAV